MKTLQHRIGNLLGTLVLGAWMASPASLLAHETDIRKGPPPVPQHEMADDAGRENRRMREVMELPLQNERRMEIGLEKALRELQSHHPDRKANAAGVSPLRVKMQQLRQASELLQAAGFQELADRTRKEIGRLEEQARRESGGDHANEEMREEMKKMRREMEELRNQLRKLKEQAAPKQEATPEQKQD